MSNQAGELNGWTETTKPSTDSVGVQVGIGRVKPDLLLSLDDQVSGGQEPKMEKMPEPSSSALGERVEDLDLVGQEVPVQVQEEQEAKTPKSSGEGMDLGPLGVTCLAQVEEKEDSQGPEVTPGCVSPVDVLLSTVGSLKTCEKTLLNATAVKLTVILHEQESDLKDKVSEIVEQLYWEISNIPVGRARRAALNVVTSLAEVSPEDVVSSLLKHSLPCNSTASEMWKGLCTVPETNTKVMWYLLRELKRRASLPEHSCSAGDVTGYKEWLAPLAAMRALAEMLKLFTCTGAIHGFYPTLFLAILTQIHFLVQLPGYKEEEEEEEEEEVEKEEEEKVEEEKEDGRTQQTAGSSDGANSQPSLHYKHLVTEHVRFALDTLRTLMLRDHNYKVLLSMEMNKGWALLSSKEEHLRGVVLLARILATVTNHHLLGLLAEVIPQLDAQQEERALTAKALFAGFLCSKVSMRLISKKRVLAKLDQWQADPQPMVRWLSFQGLENLALQKQKLRSLERLVSKMLRGLSEAHEKTVRDTLRVLPKILSQHQRRIYVGSLCVLIATKLRPLLQDEREPERFLAVRLFGELLPWVNVRHKAPMRERILTHLVPFILHMYDPSQQVVETYKWTLGRCSNFLAWSLGLEILTLPFCDCQKALDKICKSLVLWYPEKMVVFLSCAVNFLKSPKAPLRRAAGVFAGFLAFHMDARPDIPCQEALIALQQGLDCLLTDPEPSIAEVASISILQVKEARRTASALPIPSALARMVCCLQPPGEKEKPHFEDSPYQRKRSQEAFLSIPQSLH